MNFIELHIGDWIKNTRRLSLVERAIYHELILAYYTQEGPFQDAQDAYDTINPEGLTKALRDSVDKVLARKFTYQAGTGYSNERCDDELAKYRAKVPKAEAKRAADRERQDRARERRAQLYAALRELGITASYNATTAELEASLQRAKSQDRSEPVTPPVTRDNTATSPQSPVPSPHSLTGVSSIKGAQGAADVTAAHADLSQKAREAADTMKAAGLAHVDAGDAQLIALVQQGITLPELTSAAAEAGKRRKGFAWALARARGKREDAAAAGQVPPAPAAPAPSGPNPVLAKLDEHRKHAVKPPPEVAALSKRLKTKAA